MVEGRPPFRDRDRPEATLKGVDRLPLRTPVHAGPLTQTVQGLLRKNSRERLTRQVVRESLTRVLTEDPDTTNASVPRPRLRGVYAAALHVGPGWSRRTMAFGTALAVVTVAGAALAVTGRLPGTGTSSTGAAPQPPVSATASATAPDSRPDGRQSKAPAPPPATAATATATATASPTSSPPPSSSPPTTALPAGFHRYTAPEGFSVALPEDWTRVQTSRVRDLSYRVTFGADDDPRTLAVTYSTVAGPDPVAVWRDDVEPELEKDDGFQRIGEIKATTYQGHKAADMEWLSNVDGTQVRTFGRGFLLGGGRSFSLRWTTPAADWNDSANRQALDTFLRTFRSSSG